MGWYSEVSRDVSKIPSAIAYYEAQIVDAQPEIKKQNDNVLETICLAVILEYHFD